MDEVKHGSLRMDVEELCHEMDRLDSEENAELNTFTSTDGRKASWYFISKKHKVTLFGCAARADIVQIRVIIIT